jgi:hypothetical protein
VKQFVFADFAAENLNKISGEIDENRFSHKLYVPYPTLSLG